jgi:hypothetical protein
MRVDTKVSRQRCARNGQTSMDHGKPRPIPAHVPADRVVQFVGGRSAYNARRRLAVFLRRAEIVARWPEFSGLSARAIGRRLGVSHQTVGRDLTAIFAWPKKVKRW